MIERLRLLINMRITVETKSHHVGYAHHKGTLVMVDEEFIELNCGNKGVIIPISQIIAITLK